MKIKAIIIDLDGTLVNNGARALTTANARAKDLNNSQSRWDEFFEKTIEFDGQNLWCMEIVNHFNKAGYKIIFLTGRMATKSTEKATRNWLNMYVNPAVNYELIMRADRDFRRNEEIKLDLLMSKIIPVYDVLFAVDDMKKNIDMLRGLGIPALHCANF